MRPLKVVKHQEVENEDISWDFDSDDESEKLNKNNHTNLSSEIINDASTSTPSPPKYYMQKNSSSELGFHSLPRSKGRFIIDSEHCESPASINNNSVTSLNRGNSLLSNSTVNDNTTSSSSLKFPNGVKPLGRHLSLAEKTGSLSNDNLIIEKRSRFELSSHPSISGAEHKPSRFIVTEGNEGRRSRVIEVTSEPPSRHSSNGSISSSNNSINSTSYNNIINGDIEAQGIKGINRKIEILMQNSERQSKILEMIAMNINQNKHIARNSIYNINEESGPVLSAAEVLMERLNDILKELDNLKMENKILKQDIEKANKLNGQLNQKLMSLEQENLILLQKKNQQS